MGFFPPGLAAVQGRALPQAHAAAAAGAPVQRPGALAFRTGHAYWGWRFTGLTLHYIQDLTQPYHASLAPGDSTLRMITANALAMAGWPKRRDDLIVLLSNRHLALEKYQNDLLMAAARARPTAPSRPSLRRLDGDAAYPVWTDLYARDVVAKESFQTGERIVQAIVAAMPAAFVSDPAFGFRRQEAGIDLVGAMAKRAAHRAELDRQIAELLGHSAPTAATPSAAS